MKDIYRKAVPKKWGGGNKLNARWRKWYKTELNRVARRRNKDLVQHDIFGGEAKPHRLTGDFYAFGR